MHHYKNHKFILTSNYTYVELKLVTFPTLNWHCIFDEWIFLLDHKILTRVCDTFKNICNIFNNMISNTMSNIDLFYSSFTLFVLNVFRSLRRGRNTRCNWSSTSLLYAFYHWISQMKSAWGSIKSLLDLMEIFKKAVRTAFLTEKLNPCQSYTEWRCIMRATEVTKVLTSRTMMRDWKVGRMYRRKHPYRFQ